MDKKNKRVPARFLVALISLIALVIFNIIVFVSLGNKVNEMKKTFWCGYAFITFGLLLTGIVTVFSKMGEGQIFNQKVPMFILALGYLVLVVILNVIAMIVNNDNGFAAFMTINCILLLLYAAVVILAYLGLRHISENRQEVKKKVNNLNAYKARCEVLVTLFEDQGVKDMLKQLLEDVTYSDAMSGDDQAVAQAEEKLDDSLTKLENAADLMAAGSAEVTKDTVLQLAVAARNAVKKRNAIIKANKS